MTWARAILMGLLLATPQVAGAQATSAMRGHDGNAPVDFDAQHMEVQDKANRLLLTGNVKLTQQEMTLLAPRVTVAYTKNASGGPEVHRMDASGGVVLNSPTEHATGSFAIYDVDRRLITMLGGVVLTRGDSVVRGARLVFNLDTGRATLDGSSVAGSPAGQTSGAAGGRVSGRFTVPQNNAAPTPTPGKPAA